MSRSYRIYPRLVGVAYERRIADVLRSDGSAQWADRHPDQTFASIGSPVESASLVGVRQHVEAALVSAGLASAVGPSRAAEWDRTVGWSLHRATSSAATRLSPMEAASIGVWSWLTLVLMPDIALRRFPNLVGNQVAGVDRNGSIGRIRGGPRNVFRKVWWRVEVLGDLADPSVPGTLGEDELVGIFERTSLGRNRSVARAIFRRVAAFQGDSRSEFARALSRTVLRDLAHLSPALLDDTQADELVASAHARIGPKEVDGKLRWIYVGR